jgi:hypothetical protein
VIIYATKASENELSFCYYDGEKGASLISKSNAGVILCKKSMEGAVHPKPGKQQLFFLDNPRLVFVQLMIEICKKKKMVGVINPADLVIVNVYNGFGSLLYFFEPSISIMTDMSFATEEGSQMPRMINLYLFIHIVD